MEKRSYLFLVLLIFLLCGGNAIAQPNKKVAPALSKFLNTDFMLKYHDLRIEAESAVINVQTSPGIQGSDLYRLRAAYDQTAQRANKIIETIKQDFMNRKKLKSIGEFPEMYSDGLRYKLQELADFYAMNFQQPLADLSQNQVDGSAIFLLVTEMIGLTKGLIDYFGQLERESKLYTDSYLQEHLVLPYRWRYWDELRGGVSPYEKFQMNQGGYDQGNQYYDYNNNYNQSTQQPDFLDNQINQWNQKLQQDQLNQSYQQPYDNNTYWPDSSGTTPPTDTTAINPPAEDNPFLYENWNETPTDDPNKLPTGTARTKKPETGPADKKGQTPKPEDEK